MGFSNIFLGDDVKLGCFPSEFSIMITLTEASSEDMKGRCFLWEKKPHVQGECINNNKHCIHLATAHRNEINKINEI